MVTDVSPAARCSPGRLAPPVEMVASSAPLDGPSHAVLPFPREEVQTLPREHREIESVDRLAGNLAGDRGPGGAHNHLGGQRLEDRPPGVPARPAFEGAGQFLQIAAVAEERERAAPGEQQDEAGTPRYPEDRVQLHLLPVEPEAQGGTGDRNLAPRRLPGDENVEQELAGRVRAAAHAHASTDITRSVSPRDGRASFAPARRRWSTEKRPVATASTGSSDARAHAMSCGVSPTTQVRPGE